VELNNLRIKLDQLCVAVEDLATLGPQKPEELRGLSNYEQYGDDLTVKKGLEKMPPKVGVRQVEDKTNHRVGWIMDENATNEMLNYVKSAKEMIHSNNVKLNKPLNIKMIFEHLEILRGLVMKYYPAYHGLGEWEPARRIIESKDMEAFYNPEMMDLIELETATLWWAGKELVKGKLLSDYIGKNEKTKIVVRLQKAGSGPPVREPLIDEETHKKMLAFYYKKQEESKKLEVDKDDNYLNSKWADPKGLKNELHGVGNIKFKLKP